MTHSHRVGTSAARLWVALIGLTAIAVLTGCLPGDERPTPGSLEVSVQATPATQAPFATSDGWTVAIERFVTGVGDVRLDGTLGRGDDGTCNDYAETRYERLFDFVVAGREKVGLVYGLGHCAVGVRLQPPSDDPVLGAGATTDDVERMRLRGSDDYADDERTSLFVTGSASKEGRTVRFDWSFRRTYQLEACPGALVGEREVNQVQLEGEEEESLLVEIRAEELFRRAPSDLSPLQFALFAEADDLGDGDGDVTLEEMKAVEAPRDEFTFEEELEPAEDLEELLYDQLLLRVLRVAGGGACAVDVRERGPGGR